MKTRDFPDAHPSRLIRDGDTPDPQPEDRRRPLEADLRPLDTDGDGVSDSDELAAGSDPDDASDVPFDLSLLFDSPANAPAPDVEPVIPNKEFWEQHHAREVHDDGSVVITPRKFFDAPDKYTGKVADMKRDTDRDGLTDRQEYERQTDPENPDTDGDGRSDGDELAQGFDPTSPTPPNATPDDQTATASVTSMRFASEVEAVSRSGVVTTVRPDLVERLPTLDPSTLDPDINPQAFSVGFVMDEQLSIDAAIISDAALVGLGAVDDASFGAASDFGSQLEVDEFGEFGESGPIGFDGDGGDGMFGGPDGGPMP